MAHTLINHYSLTKYGIGVVKKSVLTMVLGQLHRFLFRLELLGLISEEENTLINVRIHLVEHLLRHGKCVPLPLGIECRDFLDSLARAYSKRVITLSYIQTDSFIPYF